MLTKLIPKKPQTPKFCLANRSVPTQKAPSASRRNCIGALICRKINEQKSQVSKCPLLAPVSITNNSLRSWTTQLILKGYHLKIPLAGCRTQPSSCHRIQQPGPQPWMWWLTNSIPAVTASTTGITQPSHIHPSTGHRTGLQLKHHEQSDRWVFS